MRSFVYRVIDECMKRVRMHEEGDNAQGLGDMFRLHDADIM